MAASFFPAAVPGTARNAASVMAAGCGEQRPPLTSVRGFPVWWW